MLLDFSVSNWRLITDEIALSMQATKEQQHGYRLTRAKKFGIRILPNAILFGGNASGKSAFIAALEFMQEFVTDWNDRFLSRRLEPNMLDLRLRDTPSEFAITLYLDGDLFEYSFSCTRKMVVEEKLSRTNSRTTYVLFHRQGQDFEFDGTQISEDDLARLKVIALGTDSRRLLLNNANEQKLFVFNQVYDWFKNALIIIHPSTRFSLFALLNSKEIMSLLNRWLPNLDTGIVRLEKEQISAKTAAIPDEVLDQFMDDLRQDDEAVGAALVTQGFVLVEMGRDSDPQFFRLISIHKDNEGKEISLSMSDESDGTRRMLDLIPAFCDRVNSGGSTIVIDEVDRSLHPALAVSLFESFHARCGNKAQDQIIASTHNLDLMTQSLFRRDEMWFFDRKNFGTKLISFSEFIDTKKDKDVRKSYQEGRMGGLPKLRFEQIFRETEADC